MWFLANGKAVHCFYIASKWCVYAKWYTFEFRAFYKSKQSQKPYHDVWVFNLVIKFLGYQVEYSSLLSLKR